MFKFFSKFHKKQEALPTNQPSIQPPASPAPLSDGATLPAAQPQPTETTQPPAAPVAQSPSPEAPAQPPQDTPTPPAPLV